MTYGYQLSCTLPASPEAIYEAWLDGAAHSAMTGAEATASNEVGAAFSAWDGYIVGRNLELTPGKRIVQSWRTSEFGPDDPDSRIVIALTPIKAGARLTLSHENVPDGQDGYEKGGWRDYYFEPMKAYFERSAPR